MPEDIDTSVINSVKDFIGDDDKSEKKIGWIETMLEWEEENPDRNGWEPMKHISVPPYYIGQLKSVEFVDIYLDSNNSTIMRLEDKDSVEAALQKVEDEPEKESEEWFEENITDSALDIVLSKVNIEKEDRDEIEEIIETTDCLEYWSQYIAPGLKFRDMAKKAVLIMLASPEDKHGTKGRINVMIYGPPGTGKTVIKNWLSDKFDAQTIDGPRVSKADLTYNKSDKSYGALPSAHKGVVVIEEADEMDDEPLGAALTSLGESGLLEIRDKKIPAEVRGVMLGNFESPSEIISQWSPESLNRFDFLLEFEMLNEEEKNETLDHHYKYFRKPSPHNNGDLFKKYLALIRQFEPEVEDYEEIIEYKEENINQIDNIREGISVMNVAWTIARLNASDVTIDHYEKAFELVASKDNVLTALYG